MDGLKAVPFDRFFIALGRPKPMTPLSKNISRNGPRNCRSLGYARDDKGKDDASMENGG